VPDPSFDRLEELFERELERQEAPSSRAHARTDGPEPPKSLVPAPADLAGRVERLEEALPGALGTRLERLETTVATDLASRVRQLEAATSAQLGRFKELDARLPEDLAARIEYLETFVATDVANRVLHLEPTVATDLTQRVERLEAGGESSAGLARRIERLETTLSADLVEHLIRVDATLKALSEAVERLSGAPAAEVELDEVRGEPARRPEASAPTPRHATSSSSPPRNRPCACGSGKKYKLCHGA
jgi:hypothetical protein